MPLNLKPNVDLRSCHTFGLSARARSWGHLHTLAQLPALSNLYCQSPNLVLLGEGSNTVFVTPQVEQPVVHMAVLGKCSLGLANGAHHFRVMAGENWHSWVEWTVSQGFAGLENLALIPGSVGASPVQNIGAYGVEVARTIHAVHVWNLQAQRFEVLSNADCQFAYRDSVFKQNFAGTHVIVAVDFALPVVWSPQLSYGDVASKVQALGGATPLNVMKAIVQIRSSKLPDPVVLGNAGSFFKNPVVPQALADDLKAHFPQCPVYPVRAGWVKLAAGWLIEQCGLKGHSRGQVGVYAKQALILVNLGRGSGAELLDLIDQVQTAVQQRFGVQLEAEPNLIPSE